MSLITEALQRARQEAARQEALKQRSAYPWVAPPAPDRRQTRTVLLVGVLAGCLIAVLAGGGVWWFLGGRGPLPAPDVQAAAPAPARPTPSALPPAQDPAPAVEEVAELPEPAPVPVPEIRREAPSPPVPRVAEPPSSERPIALPNESPAQPAPTPPAPPPATPETRSTEDSAASAAAAGLEDGKTYVRQVPVPGGGSLQLSGIAFSEENPVALFGDRVLTQGETVDGFTVLKVEAQQVELQGHGVKVVVTLK